jgi:hypothetical protein
MDCQSLLALLNRPNAVDLLREYFGVGNPGQRPAFAGGRFDLLDGGGDRSAVRNVITASDIVAVSFLSVPIPAEVSIDLLEGQLGQEIRGYLERIPVDIDLGDPRATRHVQLHQPADRAWQLLDSGRGMGFVRNGKLLARKRPRLIPVYDDVVRCAYQVPDPQLFWLWLDDLLRTCPGATDRLDDLKEEAELPYGVSRLRVLDVLVWRGHRDNHMKQGCPGPTPSSPSPADPNAENAVTPSGDPDV